MFGEIETAYFNSELAVAFGVVKSKTSPREKKGYSFQPISIKEKGGVITLVGKLDEIEIALSYGRSTLTDKQKVFIAWMYLLLEPIFSSRNKSKEIASSYIKEALKDESGWFDNGSKKEKWMFPYYLISYHDLESAGIRNALSELYRFLHRPETYFVDFYREILRKEKNPIRRIDVAKIAEKHSPKEAWFIREIANDLFYQKKYSDCIRYLQSVKKRFHNKKLWLEMGARLTLWNCYFEKHQYQNALDELNAPISDSYFGDDYNDMLRGVVFCRQGKWNEAIDCLERVIATDFRDTNMSLFASYYLIRCYLATKNTLKLEQVVNSFPSQGDDMFSYNVPFHYGSDAMAIVKQALKNRTIKEETRARLKGMLAYLLPDMLPFRGQGEERRKPNKKEKITIDHALRLTREALVFFPNEVFLNALCSNLLNEIGDFDEAMDFKLKSLTRKDDSINSIYVEANLNKCSRSYLETYAAKVKDTFSSSGGTPINYIEYYDFYSALGTLWEHKLYKQISDLYKYIKPHISDFNKIGEMRGLMSGGGLFEIAYSLTETEDVEEAKNVYEKALEIDGESASIFNNLAIIYEKKHDLKKAKEMISKAKALEGTDQTILNNYRRLTAGSNANDTSNKPRTESTVPKTKKKEKLSFDRKTGEISLGAKKCEIPIFSNQYQLCKALFAVPFGNWLQETGVVDTFSRGKESPRGFYDAVRFVNEKVEQHLKIKKLLVYNASRVQIRTDGLN